MSGFSPSFDHHSDAEHLAAAAGTGTVASLQAGHPFSLLLADDDAVRDRLLESTLDSVADTATRFARATNPLRARLTLERLLLQVVRGPFDLATEPPEAIIRRIAEQQGDEHRVVLVIERAETLHPEVLRFLGETAATFPDADPRLQVLFVGRPEFHSMLDHPEAGLDEQAQQFEAYRPVVEREESYAPMDYAPLSAVPGYVATTPGIGEQILALWHRGLAPKIALVGGTFGGLAALGFAAYLALTTPEPVKMDDSAGTALLEMPEPTANDPDPPALQSGPAPDPQTAQLRDEFESYLVASGRTLENMSAGQKRTVYQEFLVWRARTGAGRAP